MTRKDYRKAAQIVKELPQFAPALRTTAKAVENSFVDLFRGDNPRFDEARFREACQP